MARPLVTSVKVPAFSVPLHTIENVFATVFCCFPSILSSSDKKDSRQGRGDQGAIWSHCQHRSGMQRKLVKLLYIIICTQDEWLLSKEVVADLKEVFMLFDKDEEPCFSKYQIKLKRLVSTLETQFKCFEGSNFSKKKLLVHSKKHFSAFMVFWVLGGWSSVFPRAGGDDCYYHHWWSILIWECFGVIWGHCGVIWGQFGVIWGDWGCSGGVLR